MSDYEPGWYEDPEFEILAYRMRPYPSHDAWDGESAVSYTGRRVTLNEPMRSAMAKMLWQGYLQKPYIYHSTFGGRSFIYLETSGSGYYLSQRGMAEIRSWGTVPWEQQECGPEDCKVNVEDESRAFLGVPKEALEHFVERLEDPDLYEALH